ncbi:HCP oxidoreductase, NADH-dependent [Escherichia coli]|uniref:HCP oxidoreductase, NADH-dependent n=1 Tax=Escherichia coli TaxID=562 RepID=A0A376ZRX8_ECOLX|nr:HCP oxidoreductase, NADH-dependent [Escherichia coli]
MTMPTNQCRGGCRFITLRKKTPDVWTISLICHITTHIAPGNMPLVSVRNSAETAACLHHFLHARRE